MSVDQCIEEYTRLHGELPSQRMTAPRFLQAHKVRARAEADCWRWPQNDLHSSAGFVTSACEDEGLFASDPERCRTYGDPMSTPIRPRNM